MPAKKHNSLLYLFLVLLSLIIAAVIITGTAQGATPLDMSRFYGEKFSYEIKKFGIKAGDATLEFRGETDLEGCKALLIVFTADGFNFYDQERIYADPATLLPVRVERDVDIIGKKEQLVEFYDMANNSVRIVKYKKDKQIDEMVFEKDRPVDNLYCFLFRYRQQGDFREGAGFQMNLPTKQVDFKIVKKEPVNFFPDAAEAWFVKSHPNKYRLWFGVGEAKLPLRIDGAVGLAKTAMFLTEYQSGKIQ